MALQWLWVAFRWRKRSHASLEVLPSRAWVSTFAVLGIPAHFPAGGGCAAGSNKRHCRVEGNDRTASSRRHELEDTPHLRTEDSTVELPPRTAGRPVRGKPPAARSEEH